MGVMYCDCNHYTIISVMIHNIDNKINGDYCYIMAFALIY
jgi:hypothetical protein